MPSHRRSFVRPRVFAIAGLIIALSTLFTYRATCAPVGGYEGPAGIHYVIVRWDTIGAVYGNGCEAHIATLPFGIGLTLLVVSALLKLDER